ncbi:hypothetical protein D9757_013348 [Collybiopsis confluens]|uniref:Polyketide synthase n=1 Tax=Collybiopsis confluens TaxID=2823264 RepID=A0A8H5D8Z9_9AGAR|nr:hypothetical protein D9757_013348 [Collybiopsis confluens]
MDELNAKIAIVGIACQLPSGTTSTENLDHEEFFRFLLQAQQSYETIPAGRFSVESWRGNNAGQVSATTGSFLKDIDQFDHVEFGVSTKDARAMAPATRKLIETSFLALLNSGIEYRRRNVGCYMSGTSIELLNVSEPDEYDSQGSFAGSPAMIANRVSYILDLLGPSVPTDTACSSTATALHLAIQGIRYGECEAAIRANRLSDWISYSQGSLLSPDGKCKPFDASADGFARAEGCVVIVVKRLDHAIRDHDHIYATILSTAVNSSGSGAPAGAPVAESQRTAMLKAFERANRLPQEVSYVELHATGTAKGDPAEANWVGESFSRESQLLIGSVKGNIGQVTTVLHTEITAFLTSISKVISIIHHRTIPPNVNFNTPNPAIEWDKYQLQVPTRPTALPCNLDKPPLISLASSGIGGANAHAVLEGPPDRNLGAVDRLPETTSTLLLAGGLTPRTAESTAEYLAQLFVKSSEETRSHATALGRRVKQMTWRTFTVVAPNSSAAVFPSPLISPREAPKLAFVFSGQGPQHLAMGRELFRVYPAFRRSILEMDVTFQKLTDTSLITDFGLFADQMLETKLPAIWPISLTLPAIAIFQMALFDLLIYLGIKPDIILGHSAGETAVLYASGAAPKAMAVELAVIRGRVFSELEDAGGTMAALSCNAEQALKLLAIEKAAHPHNTVEIACYNSPSDVAISGDSQALERVVDLAKEEGILGRMIRTHVPIHSSMMELCHEKYLTELRGLFKRFPHSHKPTISTISTLTGTFWTDSYDAEYFWNNTRNAVQFTSAMEAIDTKDSFSFIEIAPHPVLSSYISTMAEASSLVLCPARRPKTGMLSTEHANLLDLCGQLTIHGHDCVNFTHLNGKASFETKPQFPPYPFLKKTFPLYPKTAGISKQMASRLGPLNHAYLRINKITHPMLAEHVVRGEPIMAAAGFFEMALEFGASALMNVELREMLSLSAQNPAPVQVLLDGCHWSVKSVNSVRNVETVHAEGYLSFEEFSPRDPIDIAKVRQRCSMHVTGTDFYQSLQYFAAYGPLFQRVMRLSHNDQEALLSIKGVDNYLASDGYILHPAVLDACFQVMTYRPFHGDHNPNVYTLPASLKSLLFHRPPKKELFPSYVYAYVSDLTWKPQSITANIVVTDGDGNPLCSLSGLTLIQHRILPAVTPSRPLDVVLQPIDRISTALPIYDQSEAITVFDSASDALRRYLSSISGRQVLRILMTREDIFHACYEIFNEYDHFFDISIPSQIRTPASLKRNTTIRVSLPEHPTGEYSSSIFDIVMVVNEKNENLCLQRYCDSLSPTGVAIFTTATSAEQDLCSKIPSLPDQPGNWQMVALTPRNKTRRIFNPDSCTFDYVPGEEMSLQRSLCGLDISKHLDVWILSDHPSVLGLGRSLRYEYLAWDIRTVLFPKSLSAGKRSESIQTIPYSLRQEQEFIFESGGFYVPRAVPLPLRMSNSPNLQVLYSSVEWGTSVFVAAQPTFGMCMAGMVLGTHIETFCENLLLVQLPAALSSYQRLVTFNLHQLVAALLAVRSCPSAAPHNILLTHADSISGRAINSFFTQNGHRVTAVNERVRLSELALIGKQFDLVVSGYSDQSHMQILRSLVHPYAGKLFSWETDVSEAIRLEPALVKRAMADAIDFLEKNIVDLSFASFVRPSIQATISTSLSFKPYLSYLLIGGIGHVGAHVALYLYEHGARNIIVTSRSGRAGLSKATRIVRRIFSYLDQQIDMQIRYETVDATSETQMTALINRTVPKITGCFMLSTVLSDALFANIGQNEFMRSYESKVTSIQNLQRSIDISSLDFLVAFSSVSGLFGNGGQSAYNASNTVLESIISSMDNTFTFICPGLLDSSLMLVADRKRDRALKSLRTWSMSTEDMIIWLSDALSRFVSQGARFSRYVPDLEWGELDKNHGMPLLGRHLVPSSYNPTITIGSGITIGKSNEIDEHASIREIIKQTLDISLTDFVDNVPLSSYGLDSLLASRLSFLLRPFVQVSQLQLLAGITLREVIKMMRKAQEAASDEGFAITQSTQDTEISKGAVLDRWLEVLQKMLLSTDVDTSGNAQQGLDVVFVTGTTGVLGTYILHNLLLNPEVRKVYAFNRPARDGRAPLAKQAQAFIDCGLDRSLLDSSPKLVLVNGDLTTPDMGIPAVLKDKILSETTHIIHNAWTINLGLPLTEFNDLIQMTVNLLKMCVKSKASFSFVSTIGVLHVIARSDAETSFEEALEDPAIQLSGGYLQSKWVAERLTQIAAKTFGLATNVIRLGLLSGGLNGVWDRKHWLPAMVESGVHIGCLPDGGDAFVSWIPIDVAAKAVIECHEAQNKVLHIVHPSPVPWNKLFTPMAVALKVPLVPYEEWCSRLEYEGRQVFSSSSGNDRGISALRLMDVYRRGTGLGESLGLLPAVTCENAAQFSETLKSLKPLANGASADHWPLGALRTRTNQSETLASSALSLDNDAFLGEEDAGL